MRTVEIRTNNSRQGNTLRYHIRNKDVREQDVVQYIGQLRKYWNKDTTNERK